MAAKKVKAELVSDNEAEIKKSTELALRKAQTLEVVDEATYQEAADMVVVLDGLKKEIEGYWAELKSNAHKAWKEICSKENQMLDPVAERRRALQRSVTNYLTKKEEERKAEQDRLDRIEAERIRREEEKLAKAAEKARAKGDEEKARAIEEKALEIDRTPQIAVTVPKTMKTESGAQATRVPVTEVKIIDLQIFLAEVVAGRAPLGIVQEWYNSVSKNGTTQPKGLTNFVKLGMFKTFPGLSIREVQQARFGGGRK